MSNKLKYLTALIIVVIHGCTTILSKNNNATMQLNYPSPTQLPIEGELPSLSNATGWINTKPLKSTDFKGKVVLINFCTYSCINWLRTLPYVRSWASKYKEQGLVVVGVHTPEFTFEKNIDNVRKAIADIKIDYPIAIDNDYAIWRDFKNQYWPALYFIDGQGHIRHHQFGEGDYEQSEKIIQQMLAETGRKDISKELVSVKGEGIEAAPDWNNLQSNENYLGYERTDNFSSPGNAKLNKHFVYAAPAKLLLNQWALVGDWTMRKESILLNKTNGKILYRFHARDVHLVMGPGLSGNPVKFRVLIDGNPPLSHHGKDIDELGYGMVSEYRLYQLIRQSNSIVYRQFEIEFFNPGAEAYSFTFG